METEKHVRELCIRNALAHNCHLTREYLNNKSNVELLCFTHPLERDRLRGFFDEIEKKKKPI